MSSFIPGASNGEFGERGGIRGGEHPKMAFDFVFGADGVEELGYSVLDGRGRREKERNVRIILVSGDAFSFAHILVCCLASSMC